MSTSEYNFETKYNAKDSEGRWEFKRTGTSIASTIRVTLRLWHLRATQRPQLARLSDQKLRDIGLTRAQAEYEAAKPFWRA